MVRRRLRTGKPPIRRPLRNRSPRRIRRLRRTSRRTNRKPGHPRARRRGLPSSTKTPTNHPAAEHPTNTRVRRLKCSQHSSITGADSSARRQHSAMQHGSAYSPASRSRSWASTPSTWAQTSHHSATARQVSQPSRSNNSYSSASASPQQSSSQYQTTATSDGSLGLPWHCSSSCSSSSSSRSSQPGSSHHAKACEAGSTWDRSTSNQQKSEKSHTYWSWLNTSATEDPTAHSAASSPPQQSPLSPSDSSSSSQTWAAQYSSSPHSSQCSSSPARSTDTSSQQSSSPQPRAPPHTQCSTHTRSNASRACSA